MRILALTSTAILMVACQAGTPASHVQPEAPTAARALGEPLACAADGKKVVPLVLDWTSQQRLELELAMKRGVALVKYRCDELEILSDCTLPGTYEFAGVTRKEEVVRIDSLDELKANLPVGAAQLGGEILRGSSINLALVLIGKSSTGWQQPTRSELPASCQGATHLVRAASVGAFSMGRGSVGKVQTTAEVFGMGAKGGSSTKRDTLTSDGDVDACKKASSQATAAPDQCNATIRLDLVPVLAEAKPAQKKPVADAVTPLCPQGFVVKGGGCTQPGAGPHVCAPDDEADCDAQCKAGDATSCHHLGLLKIDWTAVGPSGPAEQTVAKGLIERACNEGVSDACFALGQILVGEKRMAVVGEQTRAYRKADELSVAACDGGNGKACGYRAFLRRKDGIWPDPAEHIPLAQRACALGDGLGCLLLAEDSLAGFGVPRDVAQAYRVFERSCEAGDLYACVRTTVVSFLGKDVSASPTVLGLAKDPARGTRLALRACALGDCTTIRSQIEREDEAIAKSYLAAMCRAGHQPSCNAR